MTEDEAKKKMCCGPPAVAAATYWRGQAACDAPMHCIASECMAWRTSDRGRFRHEEACQAECPEGTGWYAVNPAAMGPGKLWLRDVSIGMDGGFCGLAGAPQ